MGVFVHHMKRAKLIKGSKDAQIVIDQIAEAKKKLLEDAGKVTA